MGKIFKQITLITTGIILIMTPMAARAEPTQHLLRDVAFNHKSVAASPRLLITQTNVSTPTVNPTIEPFLPADDEEVDFPASDGDNSDGEPDMQELVDIAGFLGTSNPTADVNADGIIDILDLQLIAKGMERPVEENIENQPAPDDTVPEEPVNENEAVDLPMSELPEAVDPEDADDLDFLEFFSDDSFDEPVPDPESPVNDTPPETDINPDESPDFDFSEWEASLDTEVSEPDFYETPSEDDEIEAEDAAFLTAFEESLADEPELDLAVTTPQSMPSDGNYSQQDTSDVENTVPVQVVTSTVTSTPEIPNTPTPHPTAVLPQPTATATPQPPTAQPNITCSDDAVPNRTVDIRTVVSIGVSYGGYSTPADKNADGLVNQFDLDIVAEQYHHPLAGAGHKP